MVLLNNKGYSSAFNEVALKMMKAQLKSKLPDKMQCKSTVSNLTKISYVTWAMLNVDEEAGSISFSITHLKHETKSEEAGITGITSKDYTRTSSVHLMLL